MPEKSLGLLDPAALADEVRDLAHDAHRVLNTSPTEFREIDELSRRISCLQHQIRGYPFDELSCWLDNVRQLVESS
jgi:hypothetical protein